MTVNTYVPTVQFQVDTGCIEVAVQQTGVFMFRLDSNVKIKLSIVKQCIEILHYLLIYNDKKLIYCLFAIEKTTGLFIAFYCYGFR